MRSQGRRDAGTRSQAATMDTRSTRLPFFGVCLYIASQAFQIPLIALGPSWAVWPVLSDAAVGVMLVAWLTGARRLRMRSPANREVYRWLLLICGVTAVEFILLSVWGSVTGVADDSRTTDFGMYQVFRLVEFVLVFRVAAGLPITRRRGRVLSLVADVTLVLTVLGIVGTYTGLLPTPLLVRHLPSDRATAGPWVTLSMGQWYEAGTIGYNHSYVAVQLVMLAGLSISLRPKRNTVMETLAVTVATAGVFLSASRAGMAAALFLLIAYLFRRPAALLIAVTAFALVFSAFSGYLGQLGIGVAETTERQLTLQRPLDPENLSGRGGIWQDSLAFLMDEPIRWIIGAGPGSAVLSGNNAHMLFLQIIMESGIVGLAVFCYVLYLVMSRLYRFERGAKAIFWTTGALLISSFTQETLYPVPSMGHFLGLYLMAVAAALSIGTNQSVRVYRPALSRTGVA